MQATKSDYLRAKKDKVLALMGYKEIPFTLKERVLKTLTSK